MLNSSVFKAYDIRGVYGKDWDAEGAGLVARAFVEEFGLKKVVLGWDMRVSSPAMVAAIEAGVRASGACVVKVGRVTTPMLYFATAGFSGNDAGIMITASHNPGQWNGMKLLLGDGMPVGEESGLPRIATRAMSDTPFVDALVSGAVETRDVGVAYIEKIFSFVQLDAARPLSLVVDCGNGMSGVNIRDVLARVPMIAAHVMYETPDGTFPNHEANPLNEETLTDLKREVVARGAALGIAFDGDGDRVGFVDERGAVVGGDVMTGLVGAIVAAADPGATILYDLRSRRAVARAVEAAGGVAKMSRVGHAFIKKQMREMGALFAGELSSHFYFQDFFSVECADLMVLYVLRLLQETGEPLSALVAKLQTDAHSGELNFKVRDRAAALAKIEEVFAPRAQAVSKMDGLLFDMGDWWFNVRPSNTEPLLRLNAEARDAPILAEHVAEISSLIQTV